MQNVSSEGAPSPSRLVLWLFFAFRWIIGRDDGAAFTAGLKNGILPLRWRWRKHREMRTDALLWNIKKKKKLILQELEEIDDELPED